MARQIDRWGDRSSARRARSERQLAFRLGLSAENRAAALLLAKGYRIAARRWRSPVGEIDLVVRRRRLLVFVEVKARDGFDEAAEAVTERQRRRIAAAAEAWLASHADDLGCDIRFDAILVAPWRLPRHILAAFDATRATKPLTLRK
jgi:putative endonuclease